MTSLAEDSSPVADSSPPEEMNAESDNVAPPTETAYSRLMKMAASKQQQTAIDNETTGKEASPSLPRRRRGFGKGRSTGAVFDSIRSKAQKPTDMLQRLTEGSLESDDGTKNEKSTPGSDDDEDSLSLSGFPSNTTEKTNEPARISMLSVSTNTTTTTQDESSSSSRPVNDDEEDPFMESDEENENVDTVEEPSNQPVQEEADKLQGSDTESKSRGEEDGLIEHQSDKEEEENHQDENGDNDNDDDDDLKEKAPTPKRNRIPNNKALLSKVDQLFNDVPDKEAASVKDIYQALEAEYSCKLRKAQKRVVKARLTTLIEEQASWSKGEDAEMDETFSNANEDSEPESDGGGHQDEEAGSDYEEEDEEDDEGKAPKTRRRKNKKTSPAKDRKTAKSQRRRRPSARKASQEMKKKLSAVRKQAELLRKRRMEELRVRNEELQAMEEDESRAERIAAKLDTNTDQQLRRRLEQRVELVEKLSQKRISVINHAKTLPEDDSGSESSSDDSEIELVGGPKAASKPLFAVEQRNLALGLLDMADRGARLPNKAATKKASPSQAITGRAALKARLKTQQRHMGNWWLARELNYKSVKEHVKDCKIMEEQKRLQTLRQEKERIEFCNQQLRNRLERGAMSDGEMDEESEPLQTEEAKDATTQPLEKREDVSDEDDEEAALATQIQSERENATTNEEDNEETSADHGEPRRSVVGSDEKATDESNETKEADLSDDDDIDNPLETQRPFKPELLLDKSSISEGESTDEKSNASQASQKPPSNDDGVKEGEKSKDGATQPTRSPTPDVETAVEAIENKMGEADQSSLSSTPNVEAPVSVSETTDSPREPSEVTNSQPETRPENNEAENTVRKSNEPRNQGWKALLQKEAERAKKHKRRKANNGGLVQEEADEEEEEDIVGLEDFGFTVKKRRADDDHSDGEDDGIRKADLEGVVDDVSDGEGDEEAGENARKAMQAKEDKERHKEIMRRMREGYDGRRGGIGSGAGTRGVHRFDQLTAAENREDAKRLGLLNDDEIDSDEEGKDKKEDGPDEEEDESAFLDKILKDRHLHRSSVEAENFSEDEEEETNVAGPEGASSQQEQEEEEQERVAKRFAKRARMQRLIEQYGDDEEFSQARLMDEDVSLKFELQNMKNGLTRKISQSSTLSDSRQSSLGSSWSLPQKRKASDKSSKTFGSSVIGGGTTLGLALQASRRSKPRLHSWNPSDAAAFRKVQKQPMLSGFSNSRAGSLSSNSMRGLATKKGPSRKVMGTSSLWASAIGDKKAKK